MTTQNQHQFRDTFGNKAVGTYYYPSADGFVNMEGYDHFSVQGRIVSGNADNTVTVTVQGDDGVTGTYVWDETLGCYDSTTNLWGVAAFVANNSTVTFHLHADYANCARLRVKVVIANAGALSNEGLLTIRKEKE